MEASVQFKQVYQVLIHKLRVMDVIDSSRLLAIPLRVSVSATYVTRELVYCEALYRNPRRGVAPQPETPRLALRMVEFGERNHTDLEQHDVALIRRRRVRWGGLAVCHSSLVTSRIASEPIDAKLSISSGH